MPIKRKIVTDSSSDILTLGDMPFASAPLKIVTDYTTYVDNADLDLVKMSDEMSKYKGKSSSACPSPDEYVSAFGDADEIFCVAISSGMSGSYNAACAAKDIYEEQNPGKKVCVIDSLSAGPGLKLIVEKLIDLINAEKDFDTIASEIREYRKHFELIFMLESVKNFANNGRISPIIAKAVGLLGIRIVCRASDEGTIQIIDKIRGAEKASAGLIKLFETYKYNGGRVILSHFFNEDGAKYVASLIKAAYPSADIVISELRGLCGFYAEKGGILVSFEKE